MAGHDPSPGADVGGVTSDAAASASALLERVMEAPKGLGEPRQLHAGVRASKELPAGKQATPYCTSSESAVAETAASAFVGEGRGAGRGVVWV